MPSSATKCPATYGETLRVLDAGDVVIREVRYAPNARIPTHHHDRLVFVLAIDGEASGTYEGITSSYRPMSLRSIPAGAPHSNRYGAHPARSLLIELTEQRVELLRHHTSVLDGVGHFGPSSLAAMIGRRIHGELQACDGLTAFAVEGLTLELTAVIGRERLPRRERIPRWLESVREQIHCEFRSRLSIASLASRHQVHPVHLARRFGAAYGCSPAEYVRRLRLSWAMEALRHTRDNIALVAQEAGFADHAHFSRAFKRATGVTPARYRASR